MEYENRVIPGNSAAWEEFSRRNPQWEFMKGFLEDSVQFHQSNLESAKDMETVVRHQAGITTARVLLNLPEKIIGVMKVSEGRQEEDERYGR